MTRTRTTIGRLIPAALVLAASGAQAMQALSDSEMGEVTGQDGINININSTNGIDINAIEHQVDCDPTVSPNNCVGSTSNAAVATFGSGGGTWFQGISGDGSTVQPLNIDASFDTGTDSSGNHAIRGEVSWDRARFRIDSLEHSGVSGVSWGSFVVDGAGSISVTNEGGLFNANSSNASLNIDIPAMDYFIEQEGNELLFEDFAFRTQFSNGTIGVDDAGFFVDAPSMDFELGFDLRYRNNVTNEFRSDQGDEDLLHFEWKGGLTDTLFRFAGGGVNKTQGITMSTRFNAASDFEWIVGEAEANGALIHFGDYVKLDPAVQYAVSIPRFTLDTINSGQGAKALCYGAQPANISDCGTAGGILLDPTAEAGAFAVIVRDAHLLHYPSRVELEENGCTLGSDCDSFQWGLITTLGNVDANVYAYPGREGNADPDGNGVSEGVRTDLAIKAESLSSNWYENSHLMIADTLSTANSGIGLLNFDLLLRADDLYSFLDANATDPISGATPGGLRLKTNDFRARLEGLFGGGELDDLSDSAIVSIANVLLDINGKLDMTMAGPPAGSTYVRYFGSVTLDSPSGGPYSQFALSEPSKPAVDLSLNEMSGTVQIGNGRVNVRPSSETGTQPKLIFEQDMRVANGNFRIDNVALGQTDGTVDTLGRIAVPQGNQVHGRFALKPQAQ